MRIQSVLFVIFWVCASAYSQEGSHSAESKSKTSAPLLRSQTVELDRIEKALEQREALFSEQWDRLFADQKLRVETKAFEDSVKAELKKRFEVADDDLDVIYRRIEPLFLQLFRDQVAGAYFDPYYGDLSVKGYFDLDEADLSEDLKKLVSYFKEKYGKDVSPARVLLVEGLPLGVIGQHIGRKVSGVSGSLSAPLAIDNAEVELGGPLESGDLSGVVGGTLEKIFGSRDIVMVNASLFRTNRQAVLSVIAHELRHMLDQNEGAPAFKNHKAQTSRLTRELKQNIGELSKTHPPAYLESYVYRNTDYEKRGYLEQARYTKYLGWDRTKYVKMFTRELPVAIVGKPVAPSPKFDVLFYADAFDSAEVLK